MASETTVVPGNPAEWREFDNEDYDPAAPADEDMLTELLAERTEDNLFGVIIVADPIARISDDLVKRLAGALVPTKVRRETRGGGKTGEKKPKKHK